MAFRKIIVWIVVILVVLAGLVFLSSLEVKWRKGQSKQTIVEAVEGEIYTNRLINEKSPYLLQHAHNPVDWYPWGRRSISKSEERR